MPSSNDNSPPESFAVSLVATIRCALVIAGAIIFILNLLPRTRLSEVGYFVLGLYVTYSGLLFGFAFFALLIAAFQWGLRLGLRTALGSALLFACVGALLSFARPEFEFRQVLVGLTVLVMLGSMTAAFGGWELTVKSRLAFMKDVTRLSNPRFGVDRTIGMFVFPPQELLAGYKGQVHAERGLHLLKAPHFLAAALYLKNPSRLSRC